MLVNFFPKIISKICAEENCIIAGEISFFAEAHVRLNPVNRFLAMPSP